MVWSKPWESVTTNDVVPLDEMAPETSVMRIVTHSR